MLCFNWCDSEKEEKKLFISVKHVRASKLFIFYCHCLTVEESEAHVAVLWFGDSVGTNTLMGSFTVSFSQGDLS